MREELLNSLKCAPVIAAVRDKMFGAALGSPAKVIFLLGGNIMNIGERISEAHSKNKLIFIHIDYFRRLLKSEV